MAEEKKTDTQDKKDVDPKLYELGFHLLPIIEEDHVGAEMTVLKDVIESRGGIIISDEIPKAIKLAYPIAKIIENKRKFFNSAYFGWIRFQTTPDEILKLKEDFDKNEKILRFILINAVQEKAIPPQRMTFFGKPKQTATIKKSLTPREKTLSEEEIDKTIEQLIGG